MYKNECVYSFATPATPGGIYVNLRTFVAVGPEYLQLELNKTSEEGKHNVYWKQVWTRRPAPKAREEDGQPAKKLSKVAIGVEGGAPLDEEPEYDKHEYLSLVKSGEPEMCIAMPSDDVPAAVTAVIDSVKNHDDVVRAAQVKQAAVAWVSREPKGRHPGCRALELRGSHAVAVTVPTPQALT